MDLSKLNLYCYRFFGALIALFLLSGGLGMFEKSEAAKGIAGVIGGLFIVGLQFKRPTTTMWILTVATLFITTFIVGYLATRR